MNRDCLISITYAITAGLILLLVLSVGQFPDLDLWGRLSIGALIEQTGKFPYFDVFSYTAPHAQWIDHEWLSGVIFYKILVHLGEPALLGFKYVLVFSPCLLVFDLHRHHRKWPIAYSLFLFLLLVPIIAIGYYATIRAQIFSLFFYSVFLWLLENVRLSRFSERWLYSLIPMGILWGNLHGGFILGLLLCIVYGISESIQKKKIKSSLPYFNTFISILLMLSIFNPYGAQYWNFLLKAWTLNRQFISEWQPLIFGSPNFIEIQCFTFIALLLSLFSIFKPWQERSNSIFSNYPLSNILVLLSAILMVFRALRFAPFLALAFWIVLPNLLPSAYIKRLQSQSNPSSSNHPSNLQIVIPACLSLLSIFGLCYLNPTTPVFRVIVPDALTINSHLDPYPVEAMQYLKKSPYRGNLMTGLDIGEFVYWNLYPKFKVGMDGRFEEVYQRKQFLENYEFYATHNPKKIMHFLDTTQTDFVLSRPNFMHSQILMKSHKWTVIFQSPTYWIFARAAVLNKFPPFQPKHDFFPKKILTLSDFVQPEDLKRFKAEAQ
jgi:hypothetical protein